MLEHAAMIVQVSTSVKSVLVLLLLFLLAIRAVSDQIFDMLIQVSATAALVLHLHRNLLHHSRLDRLLLAKLVDIGHLVRHL